jgi:hypothetical protein
MKAARTLLVAGMATSLFLATPAFAQPAPHAGGHTGHAMKMAHSRYGGPSYTGKPALGVTASLVAAGGGPGSFSAAKAITSMAGKSLTDQEVGKLTKQYGAARVKTWLAVFDFAVADALGIATKAGVKLPAGSLKGKQLAATLVKAGLGKDNTFYVEFLLDKALSHAIHEQVMDDIDAKFGATADADYHRITNQAMYDLAHALGMKQVKLASFH